MYEYFRFFFSQVKIILEMLNSDFLSVNLNGFTVGFFDLIVGFLAMGMIISIFWRGAKT